MSDIDVTFANSSTIEVSMYGANLTAGVTSIAGTANEITALASTGAVVLSLPTALTFTGKTVTNGSYTTPDINAGTVDSLTSLSIRSTGAAFDLTFATAEAITAGRTLSWNVGNSDRTLTLTGDTTLAGTNTGDQTITLTGDATGSGTGSFAVNVGKINGTSLAGLATGILKNTTTTGVPSIAVAGDFPTLNQNTNGSAATLTTPRAIYGNNFDGSAALAQIIASTYGGTGNGFTKFTGPTTTERVFTLPDVASATMLYAGGPLGTPSSGTATNLTGTSGITGTGALTSGSIAPGFGSINVGANSITGGAISGTALNVTGTITSTSATDSIQLGAAGTGFNLTLKDYNTGTHRSWSMRDDSGVNRLRFAYSSADYAFWDVTKTAAANTVAGHIWYAATSYEWKIAGSQVASITSTGLAVTGDISLTGALKLGNAYVATPQVSTGYIVIKDSTGTSYKVSCNV